ncbi:MAG TPA: hydrogenase maturation nickel metallochaperone HypA [Bacteroidota bacterium]|nr:hydrogenase maturation nickel metallochaperone HypA [Bacteroidota bacterium]
MHELSIAQSIIEIVNEHVPTGDGASVKTVRLTVGEMAGVVVDSLEFCFGAITQGTPLGGARLEITSVPLRARCATCGKESKIEPTLFVCPHCEGSELTLTGGRELQINEIELYDAEART